MNITDSGFNIESPLLPEDVGSFGELIRKLSRADESHWLVAHDHFQLAIRLLVDPGATRSAVPGTRL